MKHNSVLLLSLFFVTGCGGAGGEGNKDASQAPQEEEFFLQWETGDTFVVKTTYRLSAIKDLEFRAQLLGSQEGDAEWSAFVYWRFLVIQKGFVPDETSAFYPYAKLVDGTVSPITIIEVTAPKELNGAMFEAFDPVVYMIYREKDHKVTGYHFNFIGKNGRYKKTFQIGTDDPTKVDAALAQNLFITPTYLPVFPLLKANYSLSYGDDMTQNVSWDGEKFNVVFQDAIDHSIVQEVFVPNEKWFREAISPNRKSFLVPDASVQSELQARGYVALRRALVSTTTIEDKFRRPVDLYRSFTVQEGHIDKSVAPDYYPWAGYFWAMKSGQAIFGWQGETKSPSGLVRSDADKILQVTNELEETLHSLRKKIKTLEWELSKLTAGSPEYASKDKELLEAKKTYSDKRTEYQQKFSELKELLRKHFSDSQTGVVKKVLEGQIDLSRSVGFGPLDKYGLYVLLKKITSDAFAASRWEIENHYTPYGPGWYGHCNGWSAAAILTNEPRHDLQVELPAPSGQGNISLVFKPGDLKALSSLSYFSGPSQFYGERYNGYPQDDLQDIYPDVFHRLVTYYIVENHFPLVFDLRASEEVWNYPAYAVTFDITADASYAPVVNINKASEEEIATKLGISRDVAKAIVSYRNQNGAFKELEALRQVQGVTSSVFEILWTKASIADGIEKAYNVRCDLKYATDGVPPTHVDGEGNEPAGGTEHYTYRLYTDKQGKLIRGEWTSSSRDNHPDFAWVPYGNNLYPDWTESENPYLDFKVLQSLIVVRELAPPVCKSDSDCEQGQVCSVRFGECVSASGCTSDRDCATGFVCIGGNCQERPSGCRGDPLEPNDGQGQATRVATQRLENLEICPEGDEDFFVLSLKKQDSVRIVVEFTHADGDIDAKVFDESGRTIASATSSNDNEEIQFEAAQDGAYYLKVYGYGGAKNKYNLDVRITPAQLACEDDQYEDNDDQSSSVQLSVGQEVSAVLCPNDPDFFALSVEQDGTYLVELLGDHDCDMTLSDQNTVVAEARSPSEHETMNVRLFAGQKYVLKVFSGTGTRVSYLLTLRAVQSQAVVPVVINEIYYDGPGADSDDVFIEIYGPPGTSLDDYVLRAVNGSGGGIYAEIPLSSYSIGPSGFLVIGTPESAASVGAQVVSRLADLQNGPDNLILLKGSQVVDAVGYGQFQSSDVFKGEGQPAPGAPPGKSISRDANHTDTNNNAADFKVSNPTPGR